MNKKTLSLKSNRSLLSAPDAPLTPVDQTLHTPLDQPAGPYFSAPPNLATPGFYAHPQYSESDDILTDADEPGKVLKCYTVSFTPVFDQLVLGIYSHILLLPTTTPFLGSIPPLGLVSRVANETFQSLVKHTAGEHSAPVYGAQCLLNRDQLRNHALQPIILQLIRKRLLDLCAVHRAPHLGQLAPTTSVLVAVLALVANALPAAHNVYNGLGLRQLSISNLLLSEQNVLNFQNQQATAAALNRLRSLSLNLRKQSLTRNNSYTGSNWLHVGNMSGIRTNGNTLGMHADFGASTDSLQLMHDFVPQAFINKLGNSLANLALTAGWNPAAPAGGFHSMMMDYQTPPSSNKGSISLGSTPPSAQRDVNMQTPGSAGSADMDDFGSLLGRSRSSSRGTTNGSFPRPLTINTDTGTLMSSMGSGHINGFGGNLTETLHSPFVASSHADDFGYFGAPHGAPHVLGNVLPNLNGLRNGALIPESPGKDASGTKINIPGQFSLSEKKRDSLKLKRGIH